MKHIYLLLAIFLCTRVPAQDVVQVTPQNRLTIADINLRAQFAGIDYTADYAIQNYAITYTTIDAEGAPTVASGMLSIPQASDLSLPMTVYMHGTVLDREEVPSREGVLERNLVNIISSSGYITVAPDYIGLGDDDGYHPYVHAASESSAGRDLILAAQQWLDEQEIAYNDQLFITGYSQGGHAAQALHRDLQADTANLGLEVTAGAHLSGPYSISGVFRDLLFQDSLATMPGFIAYTYVSYNNVYDLYDDLDEAFVSPYIEFIDSFELGLLDAETFNARLDTALRMNEHRLIDMFEDSIQTQLRENDDDSRLVQAARENDTYNWAPTSPTLLYYCTADEQVPFENALIADSVMTALGSDQVTAVSGGPLNHGECVFPALFAAFDLFNSLAVREPTTSTGRPVSIPALRLSPNPIARGERLAVSGLDPAARYTYRVYTTDGREVISGPLQSDARPLIPANTPTGIYLIRIIEADGNFTVRRLSIH